MNQWLSGAGLREFGAMKEQDRIAAALRKSRHFECSSNSEKVFELRADRSLPE
jgi:hypothetical protein